LIISKIKQKAASRKRGRFLFATFLFNRALVPVGCGFCRPAAFRCPKAVVVAHLFDRQVWGD
jgi:hypothetical protein